MSDNRTNCETGCTVDYAREISLTPKADVLETDDGWRLYMDLPGVAADKLSVDFEKGELRVAGSTQPMVEGKVLFEDHRVGNFERTFNLGQSVDAAKITADFKDGVLVIDLPKSESLKSKSIEIRTK